MLMMVARPTTSAMPPAVRPNSMLVNSTACTQWFFSALPSGATTGDSGLGTRAFAPGSCSAIKPASMAARMRARNG